MLKEKISSSLLQYSFQKCFQPITEEQIIHPTAIPSTKTVFLMEGKHKNMKNCLKLAC